MNKISVALVVAMSGLYLPCATAKAVPFDQSSIGAQSVSSGALVLAAGSPGPKEIAKDPPKEPSESKGKEKAKETTKEVVKDAKVVGGDTTEAQPAK